MTIGNPITQTSEIHALNGLRFLAAFFVLFAHAHTIGFQSQSITTWHNDYLRFCEGMAGPGMDIFFILSGFLIHLRYDLFRDGSASFGDFLVHRLARLYPVYALFILFYCLFLNPNFWKDVNCFLMYMTFSQCWVFNKYWDVIVCLWSISTEVLLYIFYCMGSVLFNSKKRIFILLSVPVFYIGAKYALNYFELGQNHEFQHWLAYSSVLSRGRQFCVGILICEFIKFLDKNNIVLNIQKISFVLPFLLLLLVFLPFGWMSYWEEMICIGSVFVFLIRSKDVVSHFFSTKILRLLGRASYSIYLVHLLVLLYIHFPLASFVSYVGYLFFYLVSSVGLGVVIYLLYERPAHKFILSLYGEIKRGLEIREQRYVKNES